MKGTVYFTNRPDEEVIKHIGFVKAGIFVTLSGIYLRIDGAYYRYLKDADAFIACKDIQKIEMEEEKCGSN